MRSYPWLGRVSYYLWWPGISLYLLNTERTRIIVFSRDHVLVVRSWLGDGKWSLPGGGIHHGEPVIDGLLRELHEETTVELKTGQITKLTTENFRLRGVKVKLHYFSAAIPTKLSTRKQRGEITAVEWMDYHELDNSNTTKEALHGLAIWKSH